MQQGTPIQHDTTNYGTGLTTGRANLTRVKRWDVINTSQSTETKVGYNTTGSPIFTRSPLQTSDSQININYTDSFSDGQNRNTYAYPTETTIKDTVGTTSNVTISNKAQYGFDTGAVTRTEGPPPAGQSQGAIYTNAYDNADRLYQTTNAFNNAFTYIVYPTSSNVIQTYVTITSTTPPTVSSKLFDGAGRVRAMAAEHPGSTGGYVGQITVFDLMGRAIQTSNPTEIYGSWQPAGDDAASGWIYGYQTYDWKGRPRITTNQDGTTREATYGGCGCAGGEVVTVRDEIGRRQRLTSDVLARPLKKEVLGWDGTTVYSTVTNRYNARDQITSVMEQVGTSGTSQERVMTYDGFGRLQTEHTPSQSSGTATSLSYNADDTFSTKTDARGAIETYSYDNRGLITGIAYSAPSGITSTSSVSFAYDAVGNRQQITSGSSGVSYSYDPLSRLTSETRSIMGMTSSVTINYSYNLARQVMNISDPNDSNFNITYQYDRSGQLTEVTGNGYGGISEPYMTNTKYRAWGALKSYTFTRNTNTQWQYDADGHLTQEVNNNVTRQYTFDAAGRQIQSYEPANGQQSALTIQQTYDGDGLTVVRQQTGYPNPYTKYELRSSALGGKVVAELNSSGQKIRANVYALDELVAYQTQGQVFRVQSTPIESAVYEGTGVGAREAEIDPSGNNVGTADPYQSGGSGWDGGGYPAYGDGGDGMKCAWEGLAIPCSSAAVKGLSHIANIFIPDCHARAMSSG